MNCVVSVDQRREREREEEAKRRRGKVHKSESEECIEEKEDHVEKKEKAVAKIYPKPVQKSLASYASPVELCSSFHG